MIKSTKRAFTLVELIVVITILAILGTIAFISLQGYSADARNTKRTNDVNSLAQKISIEIAKGSTASQFTTGALLGGVNGTCTSTGQLNTGGSGVNFPLLNEDPTSFRDPSGCNYNYIYGTSIHSGTTITGANADVIEQLYEVYTWKENSANPTTDFISAGRTLTGSLVETAW